MSRDGAASRRSSIGRWPTGVQDFELIIDPPVEADSSAYRASLSAAMSQVVVRPSLPAQGARPSLPALAGGFVVAHASFMSPGAPIASRTAQPRASLAPGELARSGVTVASAANVAAIRASLVPAARAPRVSLTPPPYAGPPPSYADSPSPYAPPAQANHGRERVSLSPALRASLPPVSRASLTSARATLVPQPSQPARMPRDRVAASRALASFAPPPRVSWAPSDPEQAQQREQALARLCEDLVTARLIAVVPRSHARAVLAALGPLDRGLVGASQAMLEIYAEVGSAHLVQVAHGLAELAAQHGRLQAASDIYRALYQATGDADFEIRAADALSLI